MATSTPHDPRILAPYARLPAPVRGALLTLLWAAVLPLLGAPAAWATAPTTAAPAATGSVLLRIAYRKPPCTGSPDLPIVPNDPAAMTVPGTRSGAERRCLGTRPPALEIRLPRDRYAWLARGPSNPPVWLDFGTVIVNPQDYETPPLGLMVTGDDATPALEMNSNGRVILTPLNPDPNAWTEVHTPDGERLWIQAAP